MESVIKGHPKPVKVGYGWMAEKMTGSGLNGSCSRLLVGVWLSESHPLNSTSSSMSLREFAPVARVHRARDTESLMRLPDAVAPSRPYGNSSPTIARYGDTRGPAF